MKICWLLFSLYSLVVGGLCLLRYQQGQCSMFDLGIHDQACWLILEGLNPFLTTRGLPVQADHFSPMAYLWAPLYWLWDDPRVLLLGQTLWLASGIFPVYGIARKYVGSTWQAWGLGLLYLCQPCLAFSNFFDFHFSNLLSTPLLWACYGLEYPASSRIYYAALVTALCCSETAPLSLLGLVPLAWRRSGWRRAGATALLGLGGLGLALATVRWHNLGQATQYTNLYSHYGSSGGGVLLQVLCHPWQTFEQLNSPLNRDYLLQMLAPLAFLPLLATWELLPAAPVLAGNLLSWRESQHTIKYHYLAGILPFLIWAAVVAWPKLPLKHPRMRAWLLVFSSLMGLLLGPLHPQEWPIPQPQRARALADLQQLLPPRASLSLENSLGGPLSHRREAYLFPNPMQPAAWGSRPQALVDQTVLGLNPLSPGAWRRALEQVSLDYIVCEPGVIGEFPLLRPDRAYLLGEICANGGYRLIYAAEGTVVFAQQPGRRLPPRTLPPSDWWPWQSHLYYP